MAQAVQTALNSEPQKAVGEEWGEVQKTVNTVTLSSDLK